jgi:ABC-type uncharacterized transport system permease subunit
VRSRGFRGPGGLFRGLALTLALSVLNFAGLLITAASVGGLGGWTTWQFAGLFGLLEAGSGLATVILPNVWQLPVIEQRTSSRTTVYLAASAVFLPRWGGLARSAVGLVLLGSAAISQGADPTAVLLLPALLFVAIVVVGLSLLIARLGVAYPEFDVVTISIGWRNRVKELEPISIGASLLQFLLGVISLPLASALPASILYGPELRPDPWFLFGMLVAALAAVLAVYVAWLGRLAVQAPPEQQREVEASARG